MRVYQLIYTSVKCSLSDPELGLSNSTGLRVFSCTQGLTKQNIEEILRYATYRLPRNNDIEYSTVPCDPSVPEQFPKIFRTLTLSDGRYAAMQIAYAGYDFDGQAGNVFAHAFIFDDVPDDFMPEKYFNHPKYRTHLTEKDLQGKIVHYLKPLDDLEPTEGLEDKVVSFIGEHKAELTYILDKALHMLTSEEIKNLCIATDSHELTQMYLLSLKWLLPRDGAEHMGISTYNVYLPSDKQKQIVFHGTVKGSNNITSQAVEVRTNCTYIDVENTRFGRDNRSMLFRFEVKELRDIYAKYKFTSASQLMAWQATWENTTKSGIAGKLIRLKKTAGDESFRRRVMEIYPSINDTNMQNVRFEISKIMFDNLPLFEEERKRVVELYMGQCLEKICSGENIEIGNPFEEAADAKEAAEEICADIKRYMATIRENIGSISDRNKTILLELFGYIKHESGKTMWKELFEDREDLKLFVQLAASEVITGSGINAFTPANGWEKSDMSELVAYFDASTYDDELKISCSKYICTHSEEDWDKYGVTLKRRPKTQREGKKDIDKIHRMLSKVGYIPYQRLTYASIKGEVTDDIRNSRTPLLLSRLLYAFYRWQGTYGNQIEAEKAAKEVRDLLIEMRRTQSTCFGYVIPKLALEIIESPGHYHEVMINVQTMPPSFWDWFVIGCERCKRDDDKLLSYTRVYNASKERMSRIPAKKALRDLFIETE